MTVAEALNIQHSRKLRVDDFFLLSESGTFADCAKTELIDGEIIAMNAQFMPHLRAKMALYDSLRDALRCAGSPLTAFVEGTVTMPPDDAPEPDILVVEDPGGGGAVPFASVKLIVEVSDTTLTFDLGRKAQLYSRFRIPEYWVADLTGRTLHQFWEPGNGGYASKQSFGFGEIVAAQTLLDVSIATAAL